MLSQLLPKLMQQMQWNCHFHRFLSNHRGPKHPRSLVQTRIKPPIPVTKKQNKTKHRIIILISQLTLTPPKKSIIQHSTPYLSMSANISFPLLSVFPSPLAISVADIAPHPELPTKQKIMPNYHNEIYFFP